MPKGARFAAAVFMVASVSGARAQTQRVGVFFDENAQSCIGEVTNYGPDVRAHVFAYMPAGTEVNGAIIGLEMPPGFVLRRTLIPHNGNYEGGLTAAVGLNVTLQTCPVADGPVLLVSFDFYQSDPSLPGGERVPNLRLALRGGAVQSDSLVKERPHVKLCPDDPINGVPEYVEVQSQTATVNCDGDCPCTTAVSAATWTRVKQFFREP